MPLHFNKLTFNGKSTADFPFNIHVIENDGINKGKRKDKIFTSDYMTGGIVRSSTALRSRLGEVDEYEIDVVFTCNPFSYSLDKDIKTYTTNGVLNNDSNLMMYPKVTVYGNTTQPVMVSIGSQVCRLKEIKEKLVIECKQGKQNVYDKNGDLLNSVMFGDFFEVRPGVNGISITEGITKIEIECRWGAFV